MSESLEISDQRMAKRYLAVFIHKQPLEGFRTLVLPPLDSLSPLCIADFQVAASSRKKKRTLSSFLSLLKIARLWGNEISPSPAGRGLIDFCVNNFILLCHSYKE